MTQSENRDEQPPNEGRKRKRDVEETGQEQEEEVSEFVSDGAYVLWEKNLKENYFIVERGFNKIISTFIKVIEKKGWHLLCEHKAPGFVVLVKEFYANMVGVREKIVYVRGEWISFNREEIYEIFNLKKQKDGSKFKKFLKEPEYQKIVDLLTNREGKWIYTRKNPHESVARGSLIEEAKVWFYFVNSILLPSKHISTVRKDEAILLYALLKGYKINVGKIIENSIMSYYRSKYRGQIPHPAIITRLCERNLGRRRNMFQSFSSNIE